MGQVDRVAEAVARLAETEDRLAQQIAELEKQLGETRVYRAWVSRWTFDESRDQYTHPEGHAFSASVVAAGADFAFMMREVRLRARVLSERSDKA